MSIFSKESRIHPAYYQYASVSPPPPPLQLLLTFSKLCFCFCGAILCISLIPSQKQPRALLPPAPETVREESLEKRFQDIGTILNYLLTKAEAEQPSSSTEGAGLPERPRTCRVAVSKALLRIGPGKKFSPLMAVEEGFELLVDGETNGWLQVISPTGDAAWISKEVVHSDSPTI